MQLNEAYMNCYYVYVYYDPRKDNQPFYVGKGTGQSALRHLIEAKGKQKKIKNPHKTNIIRAILNENKMPIIRVFPVSSEEESFALEEYLIDHWGREREGGILTNVIRGGLGGWKGIPKSENMKRLVSEAQLRAYEDPAYREQKRQAALGNTYGKALKGIKRTEEFKKKCSDSQKQRLQNHPELVRKGWHWDEEGKKKISETKKAQHRKLTPEHIEAIRQSRLGKPHSAETKQKMSRRNKKTLTWEVTFPDGHKEIVVGLSSFCKLHKLSMPNIVVWGHTKGYKAVKLDTTI